MSLVERQAAAARGTRRVGGTGRGALGILFAPVTLLIVFFLGPMVIMTWMSLVRFPPNTEGGLTLTHYADVLTDPLNLRIAWTTLFLATTAMAIMLVIAIPLGYYMVFRAGKRELFLLLALVLADELAPVVKIYAWQVILGREGIVNWLIPGPPIEWLLFSRFAVVVTLAATYITYTTIPIYAAMKAIDPTVFESAVDLGAGWWVQTRRILIPLAAPGIFIAMILVYIPMLTDFVTSDIVGGTGSYMMGQRVRDLILSEGNWGAGSALNMVMLFVSVGASLLAYRLARLNRIQT
jgi:spermidine/putrescine transport system permease protein